MNQITNRSFLHVVLELLKVGIVLGGWRASLSISKGGASGGSRGALASPDPHKQWSPPLFLRRKNNEEEEEEEKKW